MRLVTAFLFSALALTAHGALDVPLRVRETAGVGRVGEVVRSGIPLPRSAAIMSTAGLSIVDADGAAVPAQFRILARWNAGRSDVSAPIQWLLVSFPASVAANATATYRLVTGSNPAPATPLRVTRSGNRVVVETGTAVFTIDGAAASLFEQIRFGGTEVVSGGSLTANDIGYGGLRRIAIEDAGPLSAVVIVEGTYGPLSSQRRYTFAAGSSTVIVRQTLANEGVDPIRIRSIRDTLRTSLGETVRITGALGSASVQTTTPASLVQRLRPSRTAPPRFDIETPSGVTSGENADGAVLELRGGANTIAVALERMHQYEPQALRALGGGAIAIDVAADQTWLSTRQALYATMAIGAAANEVWAPLNHPLRAWPDASWFAGSDAVDPFPAATVAEEHAEYDDAVRQTLERTLEKRDELGIHGLMTFGLYPRIWGNPIYSDEVDCGDDPTPGEAWDDLYWCTTWTDYHNTTYTAAVRAMRTGEVEWLDEIAGPAALRVLYSQIYQCSPGDDYFYCGQAPAGYGAYRADFNSSHAYFDNLQLHYWLTGDTAVVETLQRGARSMRDYLCSRRPAAPCQPHDPPIDEWANLTGRVASQWISVFRFVGLAGDDASYLDDYRNNLARAVTQQYVAPGDVGFFLPGWRPVTNPGRVTSDQLWMTALYDLKNLDRLRRDTGDASIGEPPLRPSAILAAYSRAIERFAPSLGWPNSFDVTWSGPRVGGTLQSVAATPGGGDPFLYDTGRSTLAGPVAAAATFDESLQPFARNLTRFAIIASISDGSPLGKLQGEYLARLHAAVAVFARQPAARRRAVRH
jgi:YetA-like protein